MNTEWGFCGEHGETAWDMAHEKIMAATNCAPYAVAEFLDSRFGRQFGDDVRNMLLTPSDMAKAIEQAVTKWMVWSISVATSKQYGIPTGLPYLTGFVCSFEVEAA